MVKTMDKPKSFTEQEQSQPGKEHAMNPRPEIIRDSYRGSDKLKGKVALISGGDSGIGRSVAVHFAREGADVAIIYFEETEDAIATQDMIEKEGRKCLLIQGDVSAFEFCNSAVEKCVSKLGRLNILVNNAAIQFPKNTADEISESQFRKTFETNIFPYFYLVKCAMKYLGEGDSIINTSSVTAYRGSEHLLDYSSTKGAIVSFTRSLSKMLASDNIRVNGVAPGPIWTPLIPATFVDGSDFGQDTPMGRAGQPSEVGPSYVFLASEDASYITVQFIHVNGGEIIGA